MTRKIILATATIIITSLTLWTCKKDKVSCSSEQEFCSLIDKQEFDETGAIIDNYLMGLKKNKLDKNLEKLVDWLQCMSCVDKAKILCNSCIKTFPLQSELSVEFNSSGQKIDKILDILMSDPLAFRKYHD